MSEEIKRLINEQGSAFEEFKKAMNAKVEALEKREGFGEIESKMDKILKDYDERKERMDKILEETQLGKSMGSAGQDSKEDKEYRDAFASYLKTGKSAALDEIKSKRMNAMSVDSDPDGGYTVSPVLSSRIVETVAVSNPMRQLADVQTINSDALDIIEDPADMTASAVGEKDSRTDTATPGLYKGSIPVCEYYVFPKATQKLLDDSSWDVEGWLARKAARAFSNAESVDFATGDSPLRPKGLMTYTKVANASFSPSSTWGQVGYVATGQGATLSGTGAELVDAIDALDDAYHANATFLMAQATLTTLRKTRAGASGANNFLFWMPSLVPGQPDTIVGYPVRKWAAMPAIGENAYPIAFGDFRQAYTIVDRIGIRVLRDAYTAKPYVGFYTTKRVGGGLVNFEAVKFVKCAAS